MALTDSQISDGISQCRALCSEVAGLMAKIRAFSFKYDATGLGTAATDQKFVGANSGKTQSEFQTVVSSLMALNTHYDTNNHDTNVESFAG